MKILIGPLSNSINLLPRSVHIIGKDNLNNYDIKVFDENINKIEEILDTNWIPDLVIIWGIEYNFIPLDIAKFHNRFFTIGIVIDWNINFELITKIAPLFDLIALDLEGCEHLRKRNIFNVIDFNIVGYIKNCHKNLGIKDKKHDITFVGSLNSNIQKNRGKWILKLLELSNKYKINIKTRVFGDDYVTLLNESKIIFNNSIRNEINMRTFEASACKSLLFVEDTNDNVKKLLGENCIYYNEENFETEVDKCLENYSDYSLKIDSAYSLIKEHTYNNHFNELINKTKVNNINKEKNFSFYLLLLQLNQIRNNNRSYLFLKEINKYNKSEDLYLFNEIGVSYYNYSLIPNSKLKQKLVLKSIAGLKKSINIASNYINPLINLSIIYYYEKKYDLAIKTFEECIRLLEKGDIKINGSFLDLTYSKNGITNKYFSLFKVEKEKIYYEYPNQKEFLEKIIHLILWNIYIYLCEIYIFKNDLVYSEFCAKEVIKQRNDLYSGYELLGIIKYKNKNYIEAIESLKRAIYISPLRKELYLSLFNCFKYINDKEKDYYTSIYEKILEIDK